jgi:hypothetical protein
MSSAEEMEAGKRALARQHGRSVTNPDGADKRLESAGNPTELVGVSTPLSDNTTALAAPAHDKDMAKRFLAALDPNATKFTFQLFSDCGERYAEILHGTLDEVWAKVQAFNTLQRRAGIFVTVNETDLKGRTSRNVLRVRALFVDADNDEQGERCIRVFTECGVCPSLAVNSGRGKHFYFVTDAPRDQFSALQRGLIRKLGTDAAVSDLPRVMRLPGTLHLKDSANPRLVKLLNPPDGTVQRWQLPELVAQLGLEPLPVQQGNVDATPSAYTLPNLTGADRIRLQQLFGPPESLSAGLEANIDEIRSAIESIPPTAISTEPDWVNFARGLAHEAAVHETQAEQLWELLDGASRAAPGYDEAENRSRWLRYIGEAFNRADPITIATVFHLARKHGWKGWSPPMAAPPSGSVIWSEAELKVSFSNVPHRRWLYGTYLIRGEVTVLAAPGGAGKTALATGMVVEIATGIEILGEKIFGGDLKALFINGEDGGTEIERRVWAFCLAHAHKVPVQSPDRLLVAGANDARVQRLSFLRTDKNFSMVDRSGFEVLEAALKTLRPDLLILDPLVAFCGGGNMNDNAVMSQVIRELKRLAAQFECAVLVIHHTRKGADDGNAEAISGASATVNLARRAIMPVTMTVDEATARGVLPSERTRYFKLVDAKSNLAPRSADSPWYRLHGVELPNAEPPVYPHGDNVQAVLRVNLSMPRSAAAKEEDQKIRDTILDLVDGGKLVAGQSYPYSPSPGGANNERALLADAIAAVKAATAPRQWLSGDLEAVTSGAIKKLRSDGLLAVKEMRELMPDPGRFRKGRGLKVIRTPRAPVETGAVDTTGDATTLDGVRRN